MKNLFEKSKINGMKLKNHFFRAAVYEAMATNDGHLTEELIYVYRNLAKGGVGTIITGYAYVDKYEQPNPNMMGIYDDTFILEYKRLTDLIHSYNSNIIMQIVYGGSMTRKDMPSTRIWGPSAVKNEASGIIPIEMTKENIKELVQMFADAALRAKKSGFDGVEIHAAHGYLLSQFLCPKYNTRTDEYGGSIENRARIILEVYEAVRKNVGSDYPVMIKMNSSDFMENGLTSEDSIKVGQMLDKAGIDAIEVSGGNESSVSVLKNNLGPKRAKVAISKENESYFREYAMKLSNEISAPVILTGGNRHLDVIQQIADSSNISYFALGRPLICEPDLIDKWNLNKNLKPRCVSCNQCYKTYGVGCMLNKKSKL